MNLGFFEAFAVIITIYVFNMIIRKSLNHDIEASEASSINKMYEEAERLVDHGED